MSLHNRKNRKNGNSAILLTIASWLAYRLKSPHLERNSSYD